MSDPENQMLWYQKPGVNPLGAILENARRKIDGPGLTPLSPLPCSDGIVDFTPNLNLIRNVAFTIWVDDTKSWIEQDSRFTWPRVWISITEIQRKRIPLYIKKKTQVCIQSSPKTIVHHTYL